MPFQVTTKVFFGAVVVSKGKSALNSLGRKYLIVTGTSSRANGALDEVLAALSGKEVLVFDGVVENPGLELAESVARQFKDATLDVVVGLGGGSAMDLAKAVAVLLENETLSGRDLYSPLKYARAKPIVCIPTTAGTGSEVTPYCVLVSDGRKRGFAHESIVPKIAFIDPKYTHTLPGEITLSTGLDALAHSLESYLSLRADPLTESLSTEAARLLVENLPKVLREPTDARAREKVSLGATLAGIAIAHTGSTIAHALGNPLTTEKGLRHGIASFLPLPFCLKRYRGEKVGFVQELFNGKIFDFIESLGLELKLTIGGEEVERWSAELARDVHIRNTPAEFTTDVIASVYREIAEYFSG